MATVQIADMRMLSDLAAHLHPVILCGGVGKRLWPLSRESRPKQFLSLISGRSLLQDTVERVRSGLGLSAPVILCGSAQRFMVAEQLAEAGITPAAIICEPVSRNTAPALAAAAVYLQERDPDAMMLVLPSDHYIGDVAAFADVVARAVPAAARGRLITFGIRPTRPETGYGYIERGGALHDADGTYAVTQFIEKPDLARAEALIADGAHLWNSGIFVLPAGEFLDELERHSPETVAAATRAFIRHREADGFILLDGESFAEAPSISVDHAVMEHTDRAAVVPADMAWNDVGSWRALRDSCVRDMDGNAIQGDVLADDVSNSYIRAESRLVAAVGLNDMVIVETDDAVLVGDASRSAEMGQMVERLKTAGRSEAREHRRIYRPWGYYQSLDAGERFQVKRIVVKPGARLSLQMHHHRAEHWVVASGTARITCGEKTCLLRENESVFIPMGTTHRLENPGKLPLYLIEVQVGGYLGEDDIVRFEDNYGRA